MFFSLISSIKSHTIFILHSDHQFDFIIEWEELWTFLKMPEVF